MALLLSRQVKTEVDEIWSYIAVESGSVDIADRVVDAITETFLQISRHPNLGRRRDDLRKGLRSIPSGSYVVVYRVEGNNVRIFHVVHGRRDVKAAIRQ
jgi:toxin ParE1/3/4